MYQFDSDRTNLSQRKPSLHPVFLTVLPYKRFLLYLQADNVGVLQLLEERDLPDGGGGDALLLRLQPDLLHGHDLARLLVAPLE